MKIAVLFDNLGPYHRARLQAVAGVSDLLAIEFGSASAEYAWEATSDLSFNHACVNPQGSAQRLNRRVFRQRLWKILDDFQPDVVALPGWSTRGAFLSALWAQQRRLPAIIMSESNAWDQARKFWLEAIKRSYLRTMAAAFVNNHPHRNYLIQLGFPADRVTLGYDVVDNDYFTCAAAAARSDAQVTRARLDVPARYFFASSRFIAKKNFPVLIAGYAEYRETTSESTPRELVLLGDGELRPAIEALIAKFGLGAVVHLPGFKQYDLLPSYYALADAFLHASTTEQWGLVVNEAMACALPVIISKRCGCARDLVHEGVNGWSFDPSQPSELAARLREFSTTNEDQRASMGAASAKLIAAWGTNRFATGLASAAEIAIEAGPRQTSLFDRNLLKLLASR